MDPVSSKFLDEVLGANSLLNEVVKTYLSTFKKEFVTVEQEEIEKLSKENDILMQKCNNYELEIGKCKAEIVQIKSEYRKMRRYNCDLVQKVKLLLQSRDDNDALFKTEMELMKERLKQENLESLIKMEQQLKEALEKYQKLHKQLKKERLRYNEKLSISNEEVHSQNLLIKNLTQALRHTLNLLDKMKNFDKGQENLFTKLEKLETDFFNNKKQLEDEIKSANNQRTDLESEIQQCLDTAKNLIESEDCQSESISVESGSQNSSKTDNNDSITNLEEAKKKIKTLTTKLNSTEHDSLAKERQAKLLLSQAKQTILFLKQKLDKSQKEEDQSKLSNSLHPEKDNKLDTIDQPIAGEKTMLKRENPRKEEDIIILKKRK